MNGEQIPAIAFSLGLPQGTQHICHVETFKNLLKLFTAFFPQSITYDARREKSQLWGGEETDTHRSGAEFVTRKTKFN